MCHLSHLRQPQNMKSGVSQQLWLDLTLKIKLFGSNQTVQKYKNEGNLQRKMTSNKRQPPKHKNCTKVFNEDNPPPTLNISETTCRILLKFET